MKKILVLLLISIMVLTACTSRNHENESITSKELENLPKDQKESEIDKKLAEMRKKNKESIKVENGTASGIHYIDEDLEIVKNIPDFTHETNFEDIFKVASDYIINDLKVPPKSENEYKAYQYDLCNDPRVNALYEDSDKGYLEGYENENIAIIEYETEKEGVYEYIFLVRSSKKDNWKVVHHGDTYKKK